MNIYIYIYNYIYISLYIYHYIYIYMRKTRVSPSAETAKNCGFHWLSDISSGENEQKLKHFISCNTSIQVFQRFKTENEERSIIDMLTSREESQERNIIGRHGKNVIMPPRKREWKAIKKRHDSGRLPTKKQRPVCATSKKTAPAMRNGRAQIHWWQQVKMHIW